MTIAPFSAQPSRNLSQAELSSSRDRTSFWRGLALMLALVFVVWLYQFLLESAAREVLKTGLIRVSAVVAMVVYLCICSSGAGTFIYFQF